MKKIWNTAVTIGLLLSAQTLADVPLNEQENQLRLLTPCYLDNISSQVLCGKLEVPENYVRPDGKYISLNIAVLPAVDSSSDQTPMMFLAGGPGQAATSIAAIVKNHHSEVLKTRDIILVDQRGTGESAPLTCTAFDDQNIFSSAIKDVDFSQQVGACLNEIEHDLGQFTSENAIRDFDRVRQALGHETVHLYGGSYGTRAAQVYMRMFPEHLASVVLDGVGPVEVPIGVFGQSAARSFELMLTECEASTSCNSAFPHVREEFNAVLQQLEQGNVSLQVPHPRLAHTINMEFDRFSFISVLRLQLYSTKGRTLVPFVINQANQGNYSPFVGLVSQSEFGMGISTALTANIVCNEDYARVTQTDLAEDARNTFGRDASHIWFSSVCSHWPQYSVGPDFYQALNVDIPTLLLSGQNDPVTPPSNGDITHQNLPNSAHFIVDHASHIVAGKGCSDTLIAEFFNTRNPKAVDAACLADITAYPFVTSINGSL